jgi:hypothetical protein
MLRSSNVLRPTAVRQSLVRRVIVGCVVILGIASPALAQQGQLPKVSNGASPSVVVDSVNLTETAEKIATGLYIGAVVSNAEAARGIQKAGDVWGLHVDLFVEQDAKRIESVATDLARNGAVALIVEVKASNPLSVLMAAVRDQEQRRGFKVPVVRIGQERARRTLPSATQPFDQGFEALQVARNDILPQLPKFDETFPIMFPISPLPDHFFQASKFPYPEPLIRSVRTVSSRSASTHAHTSCHSAALLGNMIHRTSSVDPDVFLIGFEGGNLSVRPEPGAVSRDKLSAIMTSYVIGIRGSHSERRDLLSENDGRETSVFRPTIHAPEELESALKGWVAQGMISGYRFASHDEIIIAGLKGRERRFRAAFFLVSSAKRPAQPAIDLVVDRFGRYALETLSTQQFRQVLSEVPLDPPTRGEPLANVELASDVEWSAIAATEAKFIGRPLLDTRRQPRGGMINAVGGSVGTVVGYPLGTLLFEIDSKKPVRYPPYVLTLEGGFLVVTPEQPLTSAVIKKVVKRVDFDERGPLGSDQTLTVSLTDGSAVVFRRTVLQAGYLDQALQGIKDQGWISGWEYSGARGQGLEANIVLYNFLGKNRKFMSSLNTWPSTDYASTPRVQWYVDGMQRLNFSLVTPEGWRQEFVEVPIAVPPIPRDMKLYAGVSTLD